jgi:hypothetical protein
MDEPAKIARRSLSGSASCVSNTGNKEGGLADRVRLADRGDSPQRPGEDAAGAGDVPVEKRVLRGPRNKGKEGAKQVRKVEEVLLLLVKSLSELCGVCSKGAQTLAQGLWKVWHRQASRVLSRQPLKT